jgi:hypothetical protein
VKARAALPLACGLVTAAATWWAWGAVLPASHDESAYLLQAGIFAQGRWADPPPPASELGFFEQIHVLSEPRRAAKYPPGHALVLTPGVAAGLPALAPVVLAGVAGGLLVALARRAAGTRVALIAWLFWLAPPHPLVLRTSYLSEATTTVLWLLGWWALARWLEDADAGASNRWLALLSLCIGFGAITRPLTTIAFAAPAAFVMLRSARWRWKAGAFAAALVPGAVLLLLIPLWSARTTGDAFQTPIGLYIRDYLPFDRPGFGPVADAPRRPLPPDLQGTFYEFFASQRNHHTVPALPVVLAARVRAIVGDLWGRWRLVGLALAALGAFFLPRLTRAPAISAVLLVLLYLAYPHHATYTIYYVESYPVFDFVTAVGFVALSDRLAARTGRPALARIAVVGAAAFLAVTAAFAVPAARAHHRQVSAPRMRFLEQVGRVPDARAIVFVRYAPDHDPHQSLVTNGPDHAHARVWVAHDRGGENAQLCRIAPERAPYLYDEATGRLIPLDRNCLMRVPSL